VISTHYACGALVLGYACSVLVGESSNEIVWHYVSGRAGDDPSVTQIVNAIRARAGSASATRVARSSWASCSALVVGYACSVLVGESSSEIVWHGVGPCWR
jgi:hypothetical protein